MLLGLYILFGSLLPSNLNNTNQPSALMFHLWSRRVASSSLKKCAVNRSFSLSRAPIDVSPEVQHALNSGSAVVALESTIITHGMPYPSNLETAITVEQQVRLTGSIPATIGVLNGRIVVGLQKKQLEILSDKSTTENIKISRRDLAAAVGLKRSGGTTISATSLVASLVGIRVRDSSLDVERLRTTYFLVRSSQLVVWAASIVAVR